MTLLDAFSNLEEFRADNHRYPLPHLVFMAVCMILCGADDWKMVSKLGKRKSKWLSRFIPLPHGVPSHHTFTRVFATLDPEQFRGCFIKWVSAIADRTHGEIVAVDGKTIRRSHDKKNDKAAIHMVNVWASETGMVLGQLKTAEKSNEITAIPTLLDMLEISGCIISTDAMGCQKSIAQKIREKKADYLLAVKGNHETLHDDIKLFLDPLTRQDSLPESASHHETLDKNHGRIEIRRCWVSTDIDWLEQRNNWKDLNMIGVVEGERHVGDDVSIERRYFISSLATDAETFLSAVRAHWSVENNLHWVLDIGFREDECRIRKGSGAENMAVFRQIALNLLTQEKTENLGVKNKRLTAAADDEYLELLLQGVI
ncbi:ISAs1 family transposase [Parendozoicomonas sp. Alg238-R29]|uniref:ISAs1 family transposase n=1 Tax=Parendozoicomonas sp. Alg238-R29 TaxID=2993446 RepID=UPI00248D811A|nr:ISAs1 family transposase [Parendozoicomonas sp. Alg238-R29]